MHLTAANFVLLNAFFAAALPHPAFPKLPGGSPDLPTTSPGGIDVPNFNTPNQNVPDDGRWVETTKPNESPDTTTNVPANTDPGRWVDPPKDQTPDISACILSGKKRGECTPNPQKWDALEKRPGETENKFSVKGRTAITNLDNVRTSPPTPKVVKTKEEMDARYNVELKPNDPANARILEKLKGIDPEDASFNTVNIRNTDAEIDAFIDAKKLEAGTDTNKLANLELLRGDLKTGDDGIMLQTRISLEQRSMVIDRSFNQKFDLHRKYPRNDGDYVEDPDLQRAGSDADRPDNEKETVDYTEQAMYSLKRQYDDAQIDPKDAPIDNIVRRGIITEDTNKVIEAAMARSGKKLDNNDDVVSFDKGSPEFEAIMGTIHGERMLQMLKDHADILGPRRIKKVSIMRDQKSIDEGSDSSTSSPSRDSDVDDDGDSVMGDGSDSSDSDSTTSTETPTPASELPKDHDMLFELEDIPEAE